MAERVDLEAAAEAGVIRAEQIGPLHDFLVARTKPAVAALRGEEDLRFIRNFHDVFLAIGITLFAVGLGVGIVTYVSGLNSPVQGTVTTGLLCAGAVCVMWALGELFARRRRLFLGAGWHSVRRALLRWVKPDGLWARVFPPEAPAAA